MLAPNKWCSPRAAPVPDGMPGLLVWGFVWFWRKYWGIDMVENNPETIWWFFPRASERRVLLIVGVWQSFSYLHSFSSHIFTCHHLIFTSSHLHIYTSHPPIFTTTHIIFSSSHLHLCTCHLLTYSSHLHIFSSSHLLTPLTFSFSHVFFYSSLFRPGAVPTSKMQPFRTK